MKREAGLARSWGRVLCVVLCCTVSVSMAGSNSAEKERKKREREAQQQQQQFQKEQKRQQEQANRERERQKEERRRAKAEQDRLQERMNEERRRREAALQRQQQEDARRREQEFERQREAARKQEETQRQQARAAQLQREEAQRQQAKQAKQAQAAGVAPPPASSGVSASPGIPGQSMAPRTSVAPVAAAAPVAAMAPATVAAPATPGASSDNAGVNTAQPVTSCLRERYANGTYSLTNGCNQVVNAMYCVAHDGNTILCDDSHMPRRTLRPQEAAQQSYNTRAQSVRSYYMGCPEGYKPRFVRWSGDTMQGRCELGDGFALLKDWKPIQTAAPRGVPELDLCIRDNECEDGDILAVSVNNRPIMREELFNKATCKRVQVSPGRNQISILAVNGTGFKGNCSHLNRNTGEITVYAVDANGNRAASQTQTWEVPGGAGSSSSMDVIVR